MAIDFSHRPVLLREVIDGLNIREDGIYVDGTLGGAGHAYEICTRLGEKGRLIGIDQDGEAVLAAKKRLLPFEDKVTILRDNFVHFPDIMRTLGIGQADGILLDIGVSSHQLDDPERGFTYREDTRLDMRMDQRQEFSAWDVVNTYSREELRRILQDYGEERFADRIAARIVSSREEKGIDSTGELIDIIQAAIPKKMQAAGGHPAKRTFQAIRIEVNRELEVLRDSIDGMIDYLAPGGRLCIITFHSLEDRIVKQCFRCNENPCICPPDFPVCVCGRKPKGHAVTRKPIVPSEEEIRENKRAKSSKLRIFEAAT